MDIILITLIIISLVIFYKTGIVFLPLLAITVFILYKNGLFNGMIEEFKRPTTKRGMFHRRRLITSFVGFIFSTIAIVIMIVVDNLTVSQFEKDAETMKKVQGIYTCNNWSNYGNSLYLYSNQLCVFSNSDVKCNWKISDNEIIITITNENKDTKDYKGKFVNEKDFNIDGYLFEKLMNY